MSFILEDAKKSKVKLKIGIQAPSGFGKTYSALLLAYGMCGDWNKIAVIDTENRSASLYEHLGPYKVINFEAPYTPERYIEAMKLVESKGMQVCIFDSATHEWSGKGGVLEIHASLGGQFAQWAKVTPRHNAFIQTMLQSSMHIIMCTRSKQDYDMGKDSNGRTTVTKVGLKSDFREGLEYEVTVNFEIINEKHLAKAAKDRTGLFDGKPEEVITVETGKMLIEWANAGVDEIEYALKSLSLITNLEELTTFWANNQNIATVERFKSAVAAKNKELKEKINN